MTAALLFSASCTKDFEEINTNPNEALSVPTYTLLTSAQKGIMDNTWDEWFNGRRGNQLSQYWASNQYSAESRYQFRTGVSNNSWTLLYAGGGASGAYQGMGGLMELQTIINLNEESPEDNLASGEPANQIAAAKILKAWTFQMLTDCWGPIPYSEALDPVNFTFPKYDSQESIYLSLLSELKSAADMIVETGSIEGDQIYNGDMVLWKKFANSLRMRVALRMSATNQASIAQQHFEEAAQNCFTSNAENALYKYSGAGLDNNPQHEDFKTRNDFAASNVMLDNNMEVYNDPRIPFYFAPRVNGGDYEGEVYGLSEANAALTPNDDVSQRSALILQADFPGIYLDYAQVEFMLAEAANLGWAVPGGGELAHYTAGVTASINWWAEMAGTTVDGATITSYLAQPGVAYVPGDWSGVLGRQKWIALYMQGIQGWCEARRLDFNFLEAPADGPLVPTGNSIIPLRFQYPLDEQTLNGVSYGDGVSLLGGPDQISTPLWWDK